MVLPVEWQPDPMTATYRRIRNVLLSHAGFSDLVKTTTNSPIGRFPDMSDPRFQRVAENVQAGDLREVILFQTGYRLLPYGQNALACDLEQTFELVGTADKLVVTQINALKWQVFVALHSAGIDLGLPGLVRDWALADGLDDSRGESDQARGTLRYTTVTRIVVHLSLPHQVIHSLFQPQP